MIKAAVWGCSTAAHLDSQKIQGKKKERGLNYRVGDTVRETVGFPSYLSKKSTSTQKVACAGTP